MSVVPPTGRPFGCPYHGAVYDGQVELPTGRVMDYPQPSDDDDTGRFGRDMDLAGRVLAITPPWATGGDETDNDKDAGREWSSSALFSGVRLQYCGKNIGEGPAQWVYAEKEGYVWLVTPTTPAPDRPLATSESSEVTFRLTRIAHFGAVEEVEGEAWKEIVITLPPTIPPKSITVPSGYAENYHEYVLPGAYPYVQYLDVEHATSWRGGVFVSDVHPERGHKAVLMGVVLGNARGNALLSAIVVDLEAGTADTLFMHDALSHRHNVPETYYRAESPLTCPGYSFEVVDVTPDGVCESDGEPMELVTSAYVGTGSAFSWTAEDPDHYYEKKTATLLAAGFTHAGDVDVVVYRSQMESVHTAVCIPPTVSGDRVVRVNSGTASSLCAGEVSDTRQVQLSSYEDTEITTSQFIQSSLRGVVWEEPNPYTFHGRKPHATTSDLVTSTAEYIYDWSGFIYNLSFDLEVGHTGYDYYWFPYFRRRDLNNFYYPDIIVTPRCGSYFFFGFRHEDRVLYSTNHGKNETFELVPVDGGTFDPETSSVTLHPVDGRVAFGPQYYYPVCWV